MGVAFETSKVHKFSGRYNVERRSTFLRPAGTQGLQAVLVRRVGPQRAVLVAQVVAALVRARPHEAAAALGGAHALSVRCGPKGEAPRGGLSPKAGRNPA